MGFSLTIHTAGKMTKRGGLTSQIFDLSAALFVCSYVIV